MKKLAILLALASTPAVAENVCAPYDVVQDAMTINLKQHKVFTAQNSQGLLIEIYTNHAGDWAVIGTNAQMVSCFLDGGEYSDTRPLPPMGEEG